MKRIDYSKDITALKKLGFYKLNCSHQNSKLQPSEKTDFLIWNLPSIKTCPFATEGCKNDCYARKSEKMYPSVLPSRIVNFEESKKDTFIQNMILTIMIRRQYSKKENLVVRIHESGDFYNQKYTNAWLTITEFFAKDESIRFIAYTKSFPYFDGKKLPTSFALRASVWNDTKKEYLQMIWKNNWKIYTAKEDISEVPKHAICRCEDCATCGNCWASKIQMIICQIH